jgi:glucose-1-phosphate cytidylyltransferase
MSNTLSSELSSVPVVLLCGGREALIPNVDGSITRSNKALVKIHEKPLFWWVLMQYIAHGASNFILAAGIGYDQFGKELKGLGATQNFKEENLYQITVLDRVIQIRVIDTGVDSTTGARLLACKSFIQDSKVFALTYSDTLSDVDLASMYRFHLKHGMAASLLGAKFPIRFRILGIRYNENNIRAFAPRPVIEAASINGGFYFFNNAVWNDQYLLEASHPLENQFLDALAADKNLAAFDHVGSWQNFDADRDLAEITRLVSAFQINFDEARKN